MPKWRFGSWFFLQAVTRQFCKLNSSSLQDGCCATKSSKAELQSQKAPSGRTDQRKGNGPLVSHKRPVSKEKANLGALELLWPNSASKWMETGEMVQRVPHFSGCILHVYALPLLSPSCILCWILSEPQTVHTATIAARFQTICCGLSRFIAVLFDDVTSCKFWTQCTNPCLCSGYDSCHEHIWTVGLPKTINLIVD